MTVDKSLVWAWYNMYVHSRYIWKTLIMLTSVLVFTMPTTWYFVRQAKFILGVEERNQFVFCYVDAGIFLIHQSGMTISPKCDQYRNFDQKLGMNWRSYLGSRLSKFAVDSCTASNFHLTKQAFQSSVCIL